MRSFPPLDKTPELTLSFILLPTTAHHSLFVSAATPARACYLYPRGLLSLVSGVERRDFDVTIMFTFRCGRAMHDARAVCARPNSAVVIALRACIPAVDRCIPILRGFGGNFG